MKKLLKNIATPLVASAIIVAGLAGAAATDSIPNPLPNAVAGNVIKATDINDLASAVGILDERTFGLQSDGVSKLKVGDGDFIAPFTLSSSSPTIAIQDSNSTGIGSLGSLAFYDSSSTRLGYIGVGSTGNNSMYLNADDPSADVILRTAIGNALYVKPNGNIGIGTANPTSKLHVGGTGLINHNKYGGYLQLRYSNHNSGSEIGQTSGNNGSVNLWIGSNLDSLDEAQHSTLTQGHSDNSSWLSRYNSNPAGDTFSIRRIAPGATVEDIFFNISSTGVVDIANLSGTGTAFVCVNASGALTRSDTACN